MRFLLGLGLTFLLYWVFIRIFLLYLLVETIKGILAAVAFIAQWLLTGLLYLLAFGAVVWAVVTVAMLTHHFARKSKRPVLIYAAVIVPLVGLLMAAKIHYTRTPEPAPVQLSHVRLKDSGLIHRTLFRAKWAVNDPKVERSKRDNYLHVGNTVFRQVSNTWVEQ